MFPLFLLIFLLHRVYGGGFPQSMSSYPDPTSFPEELRRYYSTLSEKYDCSFNRKTACMFKYSSEGWNFHQSLRELAEQLKRAAEAAAFAVSVTNTGVSRQNETEELNTEDIGNIVVPKANFFPCYNPSRPPSPINGDTFASGKLEAHIPWPRFVRLVVPIAVIDRTPPTRPRVVGPRAVLNPYAQYQEQSRERSVYQVLPVSSPTTLLACMHLKLRFPVNQSSQVNVTFVQLFQTITTGSVSDEAITPASYRRRTTTYFDWSLFNQPAVASLEPTQSVPSDVWIELSIPVDVRTSVLSESESISRQRTPENIEPSITFSSNGATWIAHVLPTVLRIATTRDVCLDEFRLRPLILQLSEDVKDANTCIRGLNWIDPTTERKMILLIDEFGVPLKPTDPSSNRETRSQRPSLHLADNRTSVAGFSWLHFAGSLVLAVSATVLFLLFVSAVGLSIVLAHKRKPNCRIRRYPAYPNDKSSSDGTPSTPLVPSLLSESVCPIKYDYESPTVDTEPNSTQCGESLFLNGTDTFRSDREHPLGISEVNTESANTTAVQLMRNWYFYRRRGNRTRQKFALRGISPDPPSVAFQPPVNPPFDFGRTDVALRTTNHSRTSSQHFGRQSLVLTTDSNNQLVILPAFQLDSAPSTNMRSGSSITSDPQLLMIPETSSSTAVLTDAEATRLELAESVRRLEDYFSQPNQFGTPELHLRYPNCESLTPATVARSQLTPNISQDYIPSPESTGSHSSSTANGPSVHHREHPDSVSPIHA